MDWLEVKEEMMSLGKAKVERTESAQSVKMSKKCSGMVPSPL